MTSAQIATLVSDYTYSKSQIDGLINSVLEYLNDNFYTQSETNGQISAYAYSKNEVDTKLGSYYTSSYINQNYLNADQTINYVDNEIVTYTNTFSGTRIWSTITTGPFTNVNFLLRDNASFTQAMGRTRLFSVNVNTASLSTTDQLHLTVDGTYRFDSGGEKQIAIYLYILTNVGGTFHLIARRYAKNDYPTNIFPITIPFQKYYSVVNKIGIEIDCEILTGELKIDGALTASVSTRPTGSF